MRGMVRSRRGAGPNWSASRCETEVWPNAEAHFRDRRCRQRPRQGAHRIVTRPPPEVAGVARHAAEARPVHQHRPGDDEPVRAR